MGPERARLLGELLNQLAQDPRGFIPDETWSAVQKCFALPYLELGVVRRIADGKVQILLSYRSDSDWEGWHVPGGLWRTKQTLEEGVAALARHEFDEHIRLNILAQGGWEKWLDHPYGVPISHIVLCAAEGVVESDTLRWFDRAPEGMIADNGHHARFIRDILQQAEKLL